MGIDPGSSGDQAQRLIVRPLELSDYEAVVDLQVRCFPGVEPWKESMLKAQLSVFQAGQIGVELDGKLVATSSSIVIDESDYPESHTFEDICLDGRFKNHDPEGDTLYGLDIVVDPEHRGQKLARRIYDARKQLVQDLNLKRIAFGGRMPGYHKRREEMSPEEYVRKVMAKELRDPVITAQRANGFNVTGLARNYLPTDVESCGHAVLMEWNNPDYHPDGLRRVSKMKVAAVQYQMRRITSFDSFARQVEFFVDTASDFRADFVLFPELLTNQLLSLVPAKRPARAARRLHEFTKQYEELFSELAISYAINVIAGTHLVVEDADLYNVAYLFHRDGRIDRQAKVHVSPGEERWWGLRPGSEVRVLNTDCGKIGIAIGDDVQSPGFVANLREQGAAVLFVPYNTDLREAHMRVRLCAQARCIENHIYAVLSGACGNLPMVEGADIHYAHSAILTPSDVHFARDGVAAEATPNVEMFLVHDLDLDLLRRTYQTGPSRSFKERRAEATTARF